MGINEIKRMVYAMRNGVAADVLRRGGAPYRMIFGVNLPQLAEIAKEIGASVETADQLWADSGVRESLLLATMVHPVAEMSREKALLWLEQAPSVEVVDVLCHRQLRHTAFASELAAMLSNSDGDMQRYAALRLYFNLLPEHQADARVAAQKELDRSVPLTRMIAATLIDELDFIAGQ